MMHAKGETATVTPRLVFDKTVGKDEDDDCIPQFLRGKATKPREPGDQIKPAAIVDPQENSPVINPTIEQPSIDSPDAGPAEPPIIENNEVVPVESARDRPPIVPVSDEDDDGITVEELQRQQEEIDRKIKAKQEAEKKAVIEQIVNVVNTYQIPVDELVEALGGLRIKRKGVKAKVKYRDPADPENTWSGRGKEPAWIKGKDRKPFLIPDDDDK